VWITSPVWPKVRLVTVRLQVDRHTHTHTNSMETLTEETLAKHSLCRKEQLTQCMPRHIFNKQLLLTVYKLIIILITFYLSISSIKHFFQTWLSVYFFINPINVFFLQHVSVYF